MDFSVCQKEKKDIYALAFKKKIEQVHIDVAFIFIQQKCKWEFDLSQ